MDIQRDGRQVPAARRELVRKRDEQLVARGVTTWGFVAFETGRPKRISDDVRAAFGPYVHA